MLSVILSLSENQAFRQDSWYSTNNATNDPLIFYEVDDFYPTQISYSDSDIASKDGLIYLQYTFREGNFYSIYIRHYYDIFEVLAVSGGIYSSVFLIGYAFTMLFSYNLLMSSLIRKLYSFAPKFPEEMKFKLKKKEEVQKKPEEDNSDLYDDERVRRAKQLKAAEMERQKTGKDQLIKMLSQGFGQMKANFDMKTGSIIWHYLTCRIVRDRQTLRNNWRSRNDYYFYQGLDKLNKEGDLGYIIKNIRIMRYFLKTVLEKDQRVLMKLKDKEIVSSADSDAPPGNELRKKQNKKLLLENYVDFMQKKQLTPEDARLFKVLG
jgi:hypothetical protein